MPYLMDTFVGQAAKDKILEAKVGDDVSIAATEKVELICSSFTDPGSDWSQLIAYNEQGDVIGKYTFPGY